MKNPVNFFNAELVNNEWWFSNINFNALMKMNSESGETEMVSTFEGFPPEEENLHIKTIRFDNLLVFIPFFKNIIHIWNIEKNCFEKSVTIDYEKSRNFINAFKDDNDIIWIIPKRLSDAIILFDIEKRKVSSFDGIKEVSISENMGDVDLWTGSTNYQNNQIYIQANITNVCYSVDCNTQKIEKIVFSENFPVVSAYPYENKLYLSLLKTSDIFEYNIETKEYTRYEIGNEIKKEMHYCYYHIIRKENKLIVTPCYSDNIIIYDIEDRKYEKLIFPEGFERTTVYSMCGFYKIKENGICVFPAGCNQFIKINTDDFTLSTVPIILSDSLKNYSEDMINNIFEKKYHSEIDENFAYKETMDMFINKLVSEETANKKNDETNAGEKIHNYIVSLFK